MKKDTFFVPSWLFYSISLLVCCISAWQLWSEPFLRGWDAYFYALHADAWFSNAGEWQFSGGNILYLLLTPLHWLGLGAENALRCWQSFSLFLLTIPFIWQLRSFKSAVLSVVLFAWVLFSPTLIYIDIGLMKTMAFLICFAFAFWFSIQNKPNLWAWALFSVAAVCFHRAAVPYVAVSAVYILLKYAGRWNLLKMSGLAGALLVSMAAYFLIWPDSISAVDVSRISSMRLTPGVISLLLRDSFPADMRGEIICTLLVMLILLGVFIKRKDWRVWYPLFLLGISFCPAFGREALCLGERLGLLFPFMSMLSCAFLMTGEETHLSTDAGFPKWGMALLAVLLLAVGSLRLNWGHPLERNQSYEQYATTICHLQKYHIPMLITDKGFPYFYRFKTGKLAFPFEPEDHWDKTQIWRLIRYLPSEYLFKYASAQCRDKIIVMKEDPGCSPLPYELSLIRGDCYEEIRSKANIEQDHYLLYFMTNDSWHPYQKRPLFLYRQYKNKSMEGPFSPCPPQGC